MVPYSVLAYFALPLVYGVSPWLLLLLVSPLFGVVLLELYALFICIKRILKRQTPWWHCIFILPILALSGLLAGLISLFFLISTVGFS
jgi:hypothetical protein